MTRLQILGLVNPSTTSQAELNPSNGIDKASSFEALAHVKKIENKIQLKDKECKLQNEIEVKVDRKQMMRNMENLLKES